MEENLIKVYVKLDSNNCITQIDSSIFIQDTTGWTQIDEGTGDKYSHAQSMYLSSEKSVIDMQGRLNYKLVDNKPVELTEDEKTKLFPVQAPEPTLAERNRADIDYIMLMQNL